MRACLPVARRRRSGEGLGPGVGNRRRERAGRNAGARQGTGPWPADRTSRGVLPLCQGDQALAIVESCDRGSALELSLVPSDYQGPARARTFTGGYRA